MDERLVELFDAFDKLVVVRWLVELFDAFDKLVDEQLGQSVRRAYAMHPIEAGPGYMCL